MKHGLPLLLALLSVLTAAAPLAANEKIDLDRRTPVAAGEQIPIADFYRPGFLQSPKVNPAGTHVAALITSSEDKHKLIVYELATMKGEVYEPPGETTISEVTWLGDQRLAFEISFYRLFGVGLYASEVGRLSNAYPLLQYVGASLLSVPPSKRLRPLAWLPPGSDDAGRDGHVGVINTDIRTGRIVNMLTVEVPTASRDEINEDNRKHIEDRIVGPTEGYDAGFLADREGNLAFGFTSADGIFTMHQRVGNRWEKAPVNLDEVDVLGFGRTRDEVIVRGPRQEGKPRALQFMNASTGTLGEVLLNDEKYDFFGSLYHEPAANSLFGARFDRNGPAMAWFNEDYIGLQKILDDFFPGVVVRLLGADDAGRILIVETYSDRQPPCYYWVNLEKRSLGLIEKSMPWIDPERMRPTSIISYKTRDGQRLDAYVTLPAGASKEKPVPLIVLPPGLGQPGRSNYQVYRARAIWAFNAEVQFWASRGYAVMRPNHRGCAGYEWMFPESDQWEFTKMAEDIATATRFVLKTGVIDPERIAISGFLLSAYPAVAAAQVDPDLFKAVVATQGTYNWANQLRALKSGGTNEVNIGVLTRHMGTDTKLRELSLNSRVGQIRAAVLVGYQRELGEWTKQSTDLLSDLNRAGVVHESAGVGGERSSINLTRTRVGLVSREEAFLAKHLK
ncbi:MAG TPA: prolyl oligopeptidase family serine peptidase [Opitutaceae bacterium]|nr:prolyl oligopeptidase family serine peptidase [Opitutaceae bacterium]